MSGELKMVDLEKHVRGNTSIYFPETKPSGAAIADILERTAKFLRVTETGVVEDCEGFFVCGNLDWISIENSWGQTEDNLFTRFWPFPEAGINSARIDAIANMYSSVLVTATTSTIKVYKGQLSENQEKRLLELRARWKRVVFFDFDEKIQGSG